jgi:molybdopterin-containing oxidoreductase family iron-sulfur binding subunit
MSSLESTHDRAESLSASAYWRSIEQLMGDPAVEAQLAAEFPQLAEAIARHDRRSFLRLLGASMALAGITSSGCRRWPVEEIRPHASRPEGVSPGVAQHYATLFELDGAAQGILAKSFDGRPIKIEGNPDHPLSLGAASTFAQASILDLYDPDRSRSIVHRAALTAEPASTQPSASAATGTTGNATASTGVASTGVTVAVNSTGRFDALLASVQPPAAIPWATFEAIASGIFAGHRSRQGDGLGILLQPTSSPSQRRLVAELRQSLPKARWFVYQPLHHDSAWLASRAAFDRTLRSHYDLTRARTILCVDSDLLGSHPAALKHARDWALGRRSVDQGLMSRMISLETSWSLTGSVADTRIPMTPTQSDQAVEWLAARFGLTSQIPLGLDPALTETLDAIAKELLQSGDQALIVAGPAVSVHSQQLVHAINFQLGNQATSIRYTEEPLAVDAPEGCLASIGELSDLLQGNVLQTLVILGGNPVYDAPSDAPLDLSSTAQRPLTTIHLSSHDNETSQRCTWHVPMAHGLEAWSDGQAWDGTYTIGQPLIEPLFEGKSAIELLSLIVGKPSSDMRSVVRTTFDALFPTAGQKGWEVALHDGVHAGSQLAPISISPPKLELPPQTDRLSESSVPANRDADSLSGIEFELQFVADAKTHDGRFANNAWLQELPEPISKLTWDNAVYVSKADADRLRLGNGDVIRLVNPEIPDRFVEAPVFVMPGQSSGCVSLSLGYGRSSAGRVGDGVGANAYELRTIASSYRLRRCLVSKVSRRHELASTQMHHLVPSIADVALQRRLGDPGRPGLLVHETTLGEFLKDHHSAHGDSHAIHQAPLFNGPHPFDTPHRWAMTIDLNACIGCSGCVVACQAENNIPVVGKENVIVNREMHWLRIDRYFKGDPAGPDIVHMPVACAHCENAPCEQVCPVAATVHDTEGTNVMVYNRCIGTRYCANNCPYKVRRFNYFDYQASDPREPSKPWLDIPDRQQVIDVSTLKKMVHNPEVTVRMRGVMEKCTYCVQRISQARITAKNEYAQGLRDTDLVREGELQTACQATCPTRAIEFGDLNDPESAVAKGRANARSYELLAELNLGARTTYLARIRNRET